MHFFRHKASKATSRNDRNKEEKQRTGIVKSFLCAVSDNLNQNTTKPSWMAFFL